MSEAKVNPNGSLAGRVAVVTGASRGIGEAIARRLAMEGAKVVVSARTMEEGQHPLPGTVAETVNRIRAAGGEATGIQCDVSKQEDRKRLIEQSVSTYGPVDILVNNAAVTYYIPITQFPEKRMKLMWEVQVFGPIELAQMTYDGMKEKGKGHVIYISSGAAFHPRKPYSQAGRGGTIYGMCKAAMERFSTGYASEVYEDNIAVNAISPGLVATPGTVFHHLVNEQNKDRQSPVEMIAEAVCYIASSEPKEITGRIDHIPQFIEEMKLQPAELI
ncbi:MAG TPA: SDR family NAD(P)-dependent oxidoreductase [Dehalococcoidia bacterium]|jgi:citronellol/citronellal dehydrogenase|nr:SDR family NAD(P)-dependent oxidoreductase [Dehalococcoidia bacterium]